MKRIVFCLLLFVLTLGCSASRIFAVAVAETERATVRLDWDKVIRVSDANATLQVLASPLTLD